MPIGRRSLLATGALGAAAAMLFPELVRAAPASASEGEVPWWEEPRDPSAMSDAQRTRFAPLLLPDLALAQERYGAYEADLEPTMTIATSVAGVSVVGLAMPLAGGRAYTRLLEIDDDGVVGRSLARIYVADEAAGQVSLDVWGVDALTLTAPILDDSLGLGPRSSTPLKCTSPYRSCRTCSSYDVAAAGRCCAACALSLPIPAYFLACAVIACSVCLSEHCTGWTYACCPPIG